MARYKHAADRLQRKVANRRCRPAAVGHATCERTFAYFTDLRRAAACDGGLIVRLRAKGASRSLLPVGSANGCEDG